MSEDTLKAYVHWISLDKEAADPQILMAKDIVALLAERDSLRARVTELENLCAKLMP